MTRPSATGPNAHVKTLDMRARQILRHGRGRPDVQRNAERDRIDCGDRIVHVVGYLCGNLVSDCRCSAIELEALLQELILEIINPLVAFVVLLIGVDVMRPVKSAAARL